MNPQPTGVEADPSANAVPDTDGGAARLPQHIRLTAVELVDRTDLHNELVHEHVYLLHPAEPLSLRGNLFVAEDLLSPRGWVFVKEAPLPHARATPSDCDFEVAAAETGFAVTLHDADGYRWHTLAYQGGPLERAAALQRFQRERFRDLPVRFVTNTWGDRNRDSRINAAFIRQEIEAAARLGADMLQIDDGWQQGTTANAAAAQQPGGQGVWEGFYDADPDFWTPDPKRFPDGFDAVLDHARSHGVRLGLWFAPDSSNDFANWQRDAETIIGLHERYGIDCFKLDSIDMRSPIGEQRVRGFIEAVDQRSGHGIVLDLDVTAGTRPGYFGLMEAATVFVENRYTDWHKYWPHATLRNLWRLARWVDPRRLRMEFLNHARNADRYADDPLAPAAYDPAYLFATVLFSQPLGWFECSNLPAGYFDTLPDLVANWREHRAALFDGTIVPIGQAPDGTAWTGFVSVSPDRATGYALVLRETNAQASTQLELPTGVRAADVELLHGSPGVSVSAQDDGALRVVAGRSRSYAFVQLALTRSE